MCETPWWQGAQFYQRSLYKQTGDGNVPQCASVCLGVPHCTSVCLTVPHSTSVCLTSQHKRRWIWRCRHVRSYNSTLHRDEKTLGLLTAGQFDSSGLKHVWNTNWPPSLTTQILLLNNKHAHDRVRGTQSSLKTDDFSRSHGDEYKDVCFLRCSDVEYGRSLPTFQRSLLPLSSGKPP